MIGQTISHYRILEIVGGGMGVCETENFSADESWLSQKPPERTVEGQLYRSEEVAAEQNDA
jgi:hypothetical protein